MQTSDKGPSLYEKTLKTRKLILQSAILAVTAVIVVLCVKLADVALENIEQKKISDYTPTPGYTPKPTPTDTPTPTSTPTPATVIMIDPGHGGKDGGSDADGAVDIPEKYITLSIGLKTRDVLSGMGYRVVMTREGDDTVWPDERLAMYENSEAEVFVSVHLNAGPVGDTTSSGCEVYYNTESNESNAFLAQSILEAVCETTRTRNRGIKENVFAVLQTDKPACLVECGFISSDSEYELLIDDDYQLYLAEGIALGIDKYMKKMKGLTVNSGNQ